MNKPFDLSSLAKPSASHTPDSIFSSYYSAHSFIDRFETDSSRAVDVIIPVVHTNELWQANLLSIYREIPVKRLLISDGGSTDDSISIAKRFPRVEILDHRQYKSLGYCLRKLVEAVEADWFVYLHSDVYLPDGWFDAMADNQKNYDWFGCPQRITALVEYPNTDYLGELKRPHAGSQMGRTAAFQGALNAIDDDYVYRQEDFVLRECVLNRGFKVGEVEDIFHYHQVMHKDSPWARKLSSVKVQVEWSKEEQIRASTMQIKGIVKYLTPSRPLAFEVETHLLKLVSLGATTQREFLDWVRSTRPEWSPWIKPWRIKILAIANRLQPTLKSMMRRIRNL